MVSRWDGLNALGAVAATGISYALKNADSMLATTAGAATAVYAICIAATAALRLWRFVRHNKKDFHEYDEGTMEEKEGDAAERR